jgi:cytoskeletal protein RodZ
LFGRGVAGATFAYGRLAGSRWGKFLPCFKKSRERSQNDWINTTPWGIVREFLTVRGTRRYGAMALSMDEQRMLAEIERRLAAEDPSLAARMSSFKRPGTAARLRTPRGRIIGSLSAVVLAVVISVLVYAMIPFRAHVPKSTVSPQATGGVRASSPAKVVPRTSAAGSTGSASTAPKTATSGTAAKSGAASASKTDAGTKSAAAKTPTGTAAAKTGTTSGKTDSAAQAH